MCHTVEIKSSVIYKLRQDSAMHSIYFCFSLAHTLVFFRFVLFVIYYSNFHQSIPKFNEGANQIFFHGLVQEILTLVNIELPN